MLHAPHRVAHRSDAGDQSKKLVRSPKKVVRGQITVRKVVRSKSAPSVRQEEGEEAEKKGGRSVSPAVNKQEPPPPPVAGKHCTFVICMCITVSPILNIII